MEKNLLDKIIEPTPQNLTGYSDIDEFLDECLQTLRDKGHDYRQGNDDDLLHNFRTVAGSVGIPIKKVWFTYFYKHYSAMVTFIKEGGQRESEPIEGRIKDMIVYLILFYRMVREHRASWISQSEKIIEHAEKTANILNKVNVPIDGIIGKVTVDPTRMVQLMGDHADRVDPPSYEQISVDKMALAEAIANTNPLPPELKLGCGCVNVCYGHPTMYPEDDIAF